MGWNFWCRPIALVCLLTGLGLIVAFNAPATADNGDPKAGKVIYQRLCTHCHGATGKGDGPIGLSLTPKPENLPEELHEEGEEFFFKIIQNGGRSMGKSPCMPAWGNQLKADDIWDVISYVQVLAEEQ
jgi:mono/diheme cytochrome c family protein